MARSPPLHLLLVVLGCPACALGGPLVELSEQLATKFELSDQLGMLELSRGQLHCLELSLVSAETPLVLTIHE